MAKKISLKNYERRATFKAFLNHELPVVSTSCEIDISPLFAFYKKNGLRLFPIIAYMIDMAINDISEMKYRIIDDALYEYDVVNPSFTVLQKNNVISFCDAKHFDDAIEFYNYTIKKIDEAEKILDQEMGDKPAQYFISNVPWIKFTSFTHPYYSKYSTIPIVTIGKYENSGQKTTIPIAIQAHHSLIDGYHLGKFYEFLINNIKNTQNILNDIVS